MAFGATLLNVPAGQRERSIVVIEFTVTPIRRIVTHLAVMRVTVLEMVLCVIVIRFVTRPAIRRCAFKDSTDVTLQAVRLDMRTGQRELCVAVIESSFIPIRRAMAHLTILRILLLDVVVGIVVVCFVT